MSNDLSNVYEAISGVKVKDVTVISKHLLPNRSENDMGNVIYLSCNSRPDIY